MAKGIGDERLGSGTDYRGQRADRIAQLGCSRFPVVPLAVGKVDEAALLVDVKQRVDERALPRCEQRDG
jgi:hypothetical protein